MSIRRKEQTGNSAVKHLIHDLGLEEKLLIIEIEGIWRKMMGENIFSHTQRIFIDKDILFVQLDSAILRHELNLNNSKLICEINKKVDHTLFKKIKFI